MNSEETKSVKKESLKNLKNQYFREERDKGKSLDGIYTYIYGKRKTLGARQQNFRIQKGLQHKNPGNLYDTITSVLR